MAQALKCDLCGKFFECKDMEEKYDDRTNIYHPRSSCIDLCPECYGKLEKWMGVNEIDS